MQDVTFTLLFAGYDTSAAALTMMLRYLKLEPRVLQQLRNEQLQVQHAVVSLPRESAKRCIVFNMLRDAEFHGQHTAFSPVPANPVSQSVHLCTCVR